jgi:membrane-associated phospholipid phosphatase
MHLRRRLVNLASALERLRLRLHLGWHAVVALLLGLVVLAVSLVALGGVTEDVTQHNGLSSSDASHLGLFIRHRPDALVHVSKLLTDLGAVPVLLLLAIAGTLMLWYRGVRFGVAVAPVFALGVAGTAVGVMKNVVGRSRPPVSLHLVSESDASFPSGHATDSTAVLLTLALVFAVFVFRRPIMRALTVAASGLLAAGIGASRLVLGVHWPTDVLAGWALGMSIALAVTMAAAIVGSVLPGAGAPRHFGRAYALVVRVLQAHRPQSAEASAA